MSYFNDEQAVYQYLGQLFVDLLADPELAAKFNKANTIVQFAYRSPVSQITIKLIEGEDLEVDLGPTELEPEVVMTMDADLAHRFWLGKVNVAMAMMRGQIKTQGPIAKVLTLGPLVSEVSPRYQALLEAAGRSDLIDV